MQATRSLRREAEAFTPSTEHLALIDEARTRVRPNRESMVDWFSAYAGNHRVRLAHDLRIVTDHARENTRIAEFGSVPLLLTLPLKQMGYDITGVDIDPSRFGETITENGLNVIQCDIENDPLPLDSESFDLVIFDELFEHLRINLIRTMSDVRRILKPGGLLLLSSPNLGSLSGLKNLVFRNTAYSCAQCIYSEYKKLEDLGHMGHVREYTTQEVVGFLEKVGFRVEKLIFRGRYPRNSEQAVARLVPSLRPFVSYVARAI